MKAPVDPAIHLLHEAHHATLATHSTQLAGYPYATVLPCVLDEAHRPMFCISALAEHTKNLLGDPRASLSVLTGENGNVQAAPRLTLLGDAERFDPGPEVVARYLRYQPDAKQYLELDFMFFRFQPKRVRFIGGLGRMGWIEGAQWEAVPVLTPQDEAVALKRVAVNLPPGTHLLGLDCFGIDYEANGRRARQRFPESMTAESLAGVLPRIVSGLR